MNYDPKIPGSDKQTISDGSVVPGNNPFQLNRTQVSQGFRSSQGVPQMAGYDTQGNQISQQAGYNQSMGFDPRQAQYAQYAQGQGQGAGQFAQMAPDNHSVNGFTQQAGAGFAQQGAGFSPGNWGYTPQGQQGQPGQPPLTKELLATIQSTIPQATPVPRQSRKRSKRLSHRIKRGIDTVSVETQSFADTAAATRSMAQVTSATGPQNPMLHHRNNQLTAYRHNNSQPLPVIAEGMTMGIPSGNVSAGMAAGAFAEPKMENGLWYKQQRQRDFQQQQQHQYQQQHQGQPQQQHQQQHQGQPQQQQQGQPQQQSDNLGSFTECFETGTNLDEAFLEPPNRQGWQK